MYSWDRILGWTQKTGTLHIHFLAFLFFLLFWDEVVLLAVLLALLFCSFPFPFPFSFLCCCCTFLSYRATFKLLAAPVWWGFSSRALRRWTSPSTGRPCCTRRVPEKREQLTVSDILGSQLYSQFTPVVFPSNSCSLEILLDTKIQLIGIGISTSSW